MRLHGFLIGQTETLLADVLRFSGPADAATSRFFRAHPKLGHNERGVIAEAVFAVLRRKMEFSHLAESGSGNLARRLALLGLMQTAGLSALKPFVSADEYQWLSQVSKIDPASLPVRVRTNLPQWIYEAMSKRFGTEELALLAAALNYPAPLDLRSNPIKATRGDVIKTLALGAMMRSTGRLYAFDVSDRRLAKLKPRLARSGLSNVNPVLIDSEHDAKIKRLAGKIDRVLVDAPCSGLGTLRRNPDLKWRQSPESVAELAPKQLSILTSAARLVKVGGRLVYATCSILEAENETIVEQFLANHPNFTVVPARDVLAEQRVDIEMGDYLSLWPHRHATDGFFAAVLERRS